MKQVFCVFSCCMFWITTNAQLFTNEQLLNFENFDKKLLSWGYYFGFNSFDYNIDYFLNLEDILIDKSFGVNVGLIGNLRVNDYIDIRLEPGLYINQRELFYNRSYFPRLQPSEDDLTREIKSTNIHLPLLIKFSTKRINNIKPFVVGGISTSINLASNEGNFQDNSDGVFRVKKYTYYYEVGFGIDLYFYRFKFTPSIRGAFAINDELIRDSDPLLPWTSNIKSMKTRAVFINFTIQ